MAKEQRLAAEQRLKRGELKALVATASLELGIDIGDVDLVCQLGSPRSIASFLQRVGRSGHAVGGTAEGTAVPAVARRSGGMRGAARLRAPRRTRSADAFRTSRWTCWRSRSSPRWPRRTGRRTELYDRLRRAWPYRALSREDFDAVLRMLAEGFATRRGRRGALIHHDAINHMLRGRRGARLTALTSGGTIPDNADYQVLLEPENQIDRHASTRTSPSKAWPATCSSSATAPTASCGSSAASCGWRMRTASRRPSRSGSARRRAAATNCPRRCRACAPASSRGCGAIVGRQRARWLTEEIGIAEAGGGTVAGIPGGVARRAGMPADAGHHRAGALLRRSRRHAARASIRRSAAGSTAPGAWRCASASAASSISNCRRRRPRTTSCCR